MVALAVGRCKEYAPPSVRVNIGAEGDVEIVVQHLVITQAFQAQPKLFIYGELWRQQSFPFLAERHQKEAIVEWEHLRIRGVWGLLWQFYR